MFQKVIKIAEKLVINLGTILSSTYICETNFHQNGFFEEQMSFQIMGHPL